MASVANATDRCPVEQLVTLAEKFDVEHDGWGHLL